MQLSKNLQSLPRTLLKPTTIPLSLQSHPTLRSLTSRTPPSPLIHRTLSTTPSNPYTNSMSHYPPPLPTPKFNHSNNYNHLLILGSGIAGQTCALRAIQTNTVLMALPEHERPEGLKPLKVTMLSGSDRIEDSNSYWAQGGIIYNMNKTPHVSPTSSPSLSNAGELIVDEPSHLVRDIINAGGGAAGGCDGYAAWKLAIEGPRLVRDMLLGGMVGCPVIPFDLNTPSLSPSPSANDGSVNNDDLFSYCLEASHSSPRIIHTSDSTGASIIRKISESTRQATLHANANLSIRTSTLATDLIIENGHVLGAKVFNSFTNETETIYASSGVVIASGGCANTFSRSTNPEGFNALGSSVSLALRSNVKVGDMEYIQFHPTALYSPGNGDGFLMSEALRGEGAKLRDPTDGRLFGKDFHESGELAPRDIVARGVYSTSLKNSDKPYSLLDISHRDATWLQTRFPGINKALLSRGFDFTKEGIPVTPAAHYTCGGVTCDLFGRTFFDAASAKSDDEFGNADGAGVSEVVTGLYCIGEAARTGLHGYNRLASTSLLEGIVWGCEVAEIVQGVRTSARQPGDTGYLSEVWDDVKSKQERTSDLILEDILSSTVVPGTNFPAISNGDERANVKAKALERLALVRSTMWSACGVVRTSPSLTQGLATLTALADISEFEVKSNMTAENLMARDAALAGVCVIASALKNEVSGGGHFIDSARVEESGEAEGRIVSS